MKKHILIVGIISGMAMAMIQMGYEGIWGVGLWSPPILVSAVVLRGLQSLAFPVGFLLVPVLLGMMIHLVNSVLLGFLFSFMIAPHLSSRHSLAAAGALYALAWFLVMWFGILPLIDPVMLNLNGWVFAMAHLVLGGGIGWFASRKEVVRA